MGRGSVDPVFGQIVRQGALADAHQLGGILLYAAGAFERAPNRFLFDPLDVLAQFQRRKAALANAQSGHNGASHDFDEWDRLLTEAVTRRADELLRAMQKS